MKKLEIKVVDNGPINWPKPAPTAEDWVIARLMVVAFEFDQRRAALNYDLVRSAHYLLKRVGFMQFDNMLKTLRNERKSK